MRLHKHRHTTVISMNMTPAIDMVFNLLIFFMVVSQVSQLQREPVQLPQVDQAQEQQRSELTINVRRDQTFVIAGRQVELSDVASELLQLRERSGNDPDRIRVVIRADERVPSRAVNDLVRVLNELGIRLVRIAVQFP